MAFLYYFLVTVHILACLFLIGVVLLQQGKGQDLASAFGGGGTQTAFGPRGQANVLSRATTILAGVFMVTSLSLSLVRPRAASVLDTLPATSTAPSPSPAGKAPAALPSAPSAAPGAAPTAPPSK
jgi:preprotein translocase subunit SecG